MKVTKIQDNTGDTIRVAGVTSTTYSDYNQLYRIVGIPTAIFGTDFHDRIGLKAINVDSRVTISDAANGHDLGVGITQTTNAYVQLTGTGLQVSAITHTNSTGVATVTTSPAHGLRPNNIIFLGGAADNFWNKEYVVTEVVDLTKFVINTGITTLTPSTGIGLGVTVRGYTAGLSAQGGNVALYDENYGGRQQNVYGGITDTLGSSMTSSTEDLNVAGIATKDWRIGDYLRVDDEIMRIKTTNTGNPLKVFRGLLGTQSAAHTLGSVCRKLDIKPIELRKPSSTRTSGHTFEFVGYGPGNYSTALPSRQETQPSFDEQLLAQSLNTGGGINVYSGMNDSGDFFIGNKRIDSSTGKEEVFATPVPTITGEDIFASGSASGVDIITPLEATVTRSLNVEGGANSDILSQFDGPVSFSQKVTSSSPEGIEANSIFLQGDATVARKITIATGTPSIAGNPGDIVFNHEPPLGGTTGFVFTSDNSWAQFGAISASALINEGNFDKVGVGTTACKPFETVRVGSASSLFSIDGTGGVGVGTTANSAKLRVDGILYANQVQGDGSGLFNLATDSLFATFGDAVHPAAQGNGISPSVGIGSTTAGRDNISLHLDGSINKNVGVGGTDLFVVNTSKFIRQAEFTGGINIGNNLGIGVSSASNKIHIQTSDDIVALFESTDANSLIALKDNNTTNNVQIGAVTDDLRILTGGSERVRLSSAGKVGIATATPRAVLDVEGDTRLKTYHEAPVTLTSSGQVVNIDLSKGQTFQLTTTENIVEFRISNFVADMATSFTIKILQGSLARTVDIDDFKNSAGSASIPVNWPGGVVPTVTASANAVDIYSFMTFDGGDRLYGVVGGQNFL